MTWIIGGLIVLYVAYCLSYIFFQRKIIFRPVKLPPDNAFSPGLPHEELFISTEDGAQLNALLLLPESAKGVVIYFHGNRSHLAHHLPHTKKFTEAGYAVLISDYRGFGKSTGKLTEHHFSSDALRWYNKVSQQFPADKIIVYGRSLGTAAASWLAANEACSRLILEAPYYNMYDLARRYGMLIPDGNYLTFSFRNNEHLQKVKAPITILHGTKDKVVSVRSAYRLKKYLKSGDQFIEISGARHKDLGDFPEFNQTIWKLLK